MSMCEMKLSYKINCYIKSGKNIKVVHLNFKNVFIYFQIFYIQIFIQIIINEIFQEMETSVA